MTTRLKNFNSLAFIQSVDKPRCLVPLLARFQDYFTSRGIDLANLKNGDVQDRRILSLFTSPGDLPDELLDALYILDDLCDETGHDRILEIAEDEGADLDGIIGTDLSAAEFAITTFMRHPHLVRAAHDRTHHRTVKNFVEHQARGNQPLTMHHVKEKLPAMREEMGLWFETKDRTRACEIHAYRESDEIKFEVTHGEPFRTDGTIERDLKRSRRGWRPQKHDSVIYDLRTKILKVNSATVGQKDLYRRTFGKILFGDPDYFPTGNVYTLEPLSQSGPVLSCPAGVERACLTEVWIELDDEFRFVQKSCAMDLLAAHGRFGAPNLAQGVIRRASFLVKYKSGGRPRKIEIRPPNVAIYDRARDPETAEAFIQANGFTTVELRCAA